MFWDLNPSSNGQIDPDVLNACVPKIGSFFWVHADTYKDGHCNDWSIALMDAATAVRAYKILQAGPHSPQSLALSLVKQGIAFHTFQPLSFEITAELVGRDRKLFRGTGYRFGMEDYAMYVRQRGQLLSSPRGRAALLYGGVMWRLALEHIGAESAVLGPSVSVLDNGLGDIVHVEGVGFVGDDKLTDDELAIICGLYHVSTGNLLLFLCIQPAKFPTTGQSAGEKQNNDQRSLISYWPLSDRWSHHSNSYNWGFWTLIDEEWFQSRTRDLASGKNQPVTQGKWRDLLKGAASWRTQGESGKKIPDPGVVVSPGRRPEKKSLDLPLF